MIKVTATGGALNGKTFLVPESATTLDPHPAARGGRYRVKGKQAVWTPDKPAEAPKKTAQGTTEPPAKGK